MDIKSIGYIYFQKKSMSKASLLNRKFDNRFANSYVLGCLNFFLEIRTFFYYSSIKDLLQKIKPNV